MTLAPVYHAGNGIPPYKRCAGPGVLQGRALGSLLRARGTTSSDLPRPISAANTTPPPTPLYRTLTGLRSARARRLGVRWAVRG